jgi:ubiquinone/menaquinone biosynthesis C-methylase UbiE
MGLYANYVFAPLMDWGLSRPAVNVLRERIVGEVAGRVLEIGFGTGLNLPFYRREVSRLVLIDNAALLPRRVQRRIDACRAGAVERIILSAGKLPLADRSFDFVVSTFTLCTIADVAAALAEIRRVLAPGGRFLFLEHGRSDSAARARWQDRLNPLQKVLGCGCNMNRPISRLIEGEGLAIADLDRSPIPGFPPTLMEIYRGSAHPR